MPQDSDLTTAARVRAVARLSGRNSEADDLRLDILVSAASDAIRRYTGRDFLWREAPDGFDPDATESKTFEYDGGGYLSFGRFEARSVDSVTMDGDALDLDDEWRLGPTTKTVVDTYTHLLKLPALDSEDDIVVDLVVVGTWGIVDLPSDVELAAIDTVADWWSNPQGVRSRVFEGQSLDDDGGVLDFSRGALPLRARLLLEPYRR